jgi:hypothetical protein
VPLGVLAHQGVVLPLKIKFTDWFDGTALCVGSFIPDLEWIISLFYAGIAPRTFHSVGELVYTVPVSLLIVALLDKALLPAVAALAKDKRLGLFSQGLTFFGVDEYYVIKAKRLSLGWLVKATYSVLVGVLSHFLLDLPTHSSISYLRPFYDGMMPEWFLYEHVRLDLPFYSVVQVTNYNILWFIFSLVFSVLALYCMRYMKKHHLLLKWYRK